MYRVILPRLFENMEEGTIGRWLVSVGQHIQEQTPICEIITEKTTLELPSEAAGTVLKLGAPEKAVLPPGFILALIGDESEELPDINAENAALAPKAPEHGEAALITPPTSKTPNAESAPASTSSRVRATPAARRVAREMGVEIEAVALKFPGKVVGEADVIAFAKDNS